MKENQEVKHRFDVRTKIFKSAVYSPTETDYRDRCSKGRMKNNPVLNRGIVYKNSGYRN